jgi:hypothetical protein
MSYPAGPYTVQVVVAQGDRRGELMEEENLGSLSAAQAHARRSARFWAADLGVTCGYRVTNAYGVVRSEGTVA